VDTTMMKVKNIEEVYKRKYCIEKKKTYSS